MLAVVAVVVEVVEVNVMLEFVVMESGKCGGADGSEM